MNTSLGITFWPTLYMPFSVNNNQQKEMNLFHGGTHTAYL